MQEPSRHALAHLHYYVLDTVWSLANITICDFASEDKNEQKMSYKKLCNHSPHILPVSVLACCLAFFWEHTHTFAKVSLTIEWLLQQCRFISQSDDISAVDSLLILEILRGFLLLCDDCIWWHSGSFRCYQAPCTCGADKKLYFLLLKMWISPHNMTSLALYYFTNWIKSH